MMRDGYKQKRRARLTPLRTKENFVLTREKAEAIIETRFDAARLSGLNEFNAPGHYALVDSRGAIGFSVFYPNGTPDSQDPVTHCRITAKNYERAGRTVTAQFADARENIAGFAWRKK